MKATIITPITSDYDKVTLVQFYENSDITLFNNYTSEESARENKDNYTVGIWKEKSIIKN